MTRSQNRDGAPVNSPTSSPWWQPKWLDRNGNGLWGRREGEADRGVRAASRHRQLGSCRCTAPQGFHLTPWGGVTGLTFFFFLRKGKGFPLTAVSTPVS